MRKEVFRIFATMAVVFLLVPALCAGGKNPPFMVSSTIPTILATGVAKDQVLTVTFNQNVDCSTVTPSTFTLKRDRERWIPSRENRTSCSRSRNSRLLGDEGDLYTVKPSRSPYQLYCHDYKQGERCERPENPV